MNPNGLSKCSRCSRVLIDEEFDGHVCTPKLGKTKTIEFDFSGITKTPEGATVVIIKAMDGTLYRFIERVATTVDRLCFEPAKRDVTDGEPNGDVTEPASRY